MESSQPIFKAEFFKNNRRRLRQMCPATSLIIIAANGALQSDSYSPFAFRQDSSFWYLTGSNEPDSILVLDGENEYLIVPQRSDRKIAFDGDLDYAAMQSSSGVNEVVFAKEGWDRLGKRLKKAKQAATLAPVPSYIPELAMYSNPARRTLVRRLKSRSPQLEITDLRPQLAAMRMIKNSAELSAIQYAIDHTVKLYNLIGKKLPHYRAEQEIAADTAHYLAKNQLNYAYEPIIAGGPRATVLHYKENNAALNPNECLLIDMGAAAAPYYCADITRVFAADPSARQLSVYAAVLAVQQFAIEYLKPGVLLRDYEKAVNRFMGEKLRELGLVSSIDQESVRKFYPHSTSHFLGLDVHDAGDYSVPLREGMVLTVEPGIYIRQESLGIRIEDDILITQTGNKVLSAHLPKSLGAPTMSAS